MYHYVYQITNLIDGKIYVGKHSTEDLEDGYMGSGKLLNLAIKKHGIENFRKYIVKMCETSEEAFLLESQIVDIDFINREDVYNLKCGGLGGGDWSESNQYWANHPDEKRSQTRLAAKGLQDRLKSDLEFRKKVFEKRAEITKELWKNGVFDEVIPDWTGKRHTPETKQKIGASSAKHQLGSGNSQFGTAWVTNVESGTSLKIKKDELNSFLESGWVRGRKMPTKI